MGDFRPRLALLTAICAIGEAVYYLAKQNINSSPNWRYAIVVTIIDVISSTSHTRQVMCRHSPPLLSTTNLTKCVHTVTN